MADMPGRPAYEPDGRASVADEDEQGWGSPVPAEYGSLRAVRPARRGSGGRTAAAHRDTSDAESGGSDRWTVTSLLRKLQGDGDAAGTGSVDPGGRAAGPAAAPAADPSPARPQSSSNRSSSTRLGASRSVSGRGSTRGVSRSGQARGRGAPEIASPLAAEQAALPASSPSLSPPAAEALVRPRPGGAEPPPGPERRRRVDPTVMQTALGDPTVADAPTRPPGIGPGPAPGPAVQGPGMPIPAVDPATTGARRGRRSARRILRLQTRATIRHVDMWSVVKVSLLFYLVILIAFVVASVLLWYAADAFGTLPSIEKSVRTLFSLKTFNVKVSQVAKYTTVIGLVLAVVGTLSNILLALIYNLISDIVGGIRVEMDSVSTD